MVRSICPGLSDSIDPTESDAGCMANGSPMQARVSIRSLLELKISEMHWRKSRGKAIGERLIRTKNRSDLWWKTEAMMCAMMTICNPGDKVMVFSPFYENYGAAVCDPVRTQNPSTFTRSTGVWILISAGGRRI